MKNMIVMMMMMRMMMTMRMVIAMVMAMATIMTIITRMTVTRVSDEIQAPSTSPHQLPNTRVGILEATETSYSMYSVTRMVVPPCSFQVLVPLLAHVKSFLQCRVSLYSPSASVRILSGDYDMTFSNQRKAALNPKPVKESLSNVLNGGYCPPTH